MQSVYVPRLLFRQQIYKKAAQLYELFEVKIT